MFRRELFQRMARVLDALDASVLVQTSFRFGGGTCLSLAHGEYRLSRDLDFICSDAEGYAELRFAVRERGYDALFPPAGRAALGFPREIRADQYGLRFPVIVGSVSIRVEMIREARIALGPAEQAAWTQVPLLSIADAYAEKLLANSNRWADRDELARDLVDLAVLRAARSYSGSRLGSRGACLPFGAGRRSAQGGGAVSGGTRLSATMLRRARGGGNGWCASRRARAARGSRGGQGVASFGG